MKVEQIYSILNTVTGEITGKTGLLREDLSNLSDLGTEVFGASSVDNYVKSLVNHIGKVVFVDRVYNGSVPSIMMDSWEFGSVLQKVSCEIPEAVENESWELENGKTYNPNIFYKPVVSSKFFNNKLTFEINCSFTEIQVKESFSSAEQMNGFLSMIQNSVEKSLTVKIDSLVMRTINRGIAETINQSIPDGLIGNISTPKAVNLLKLYNDEYNKTLDAAHAMYDIDFIRYASYVMMVTKERMSKLSTLYNVGEKDRFTPADSLHCVMLADFRKTIDVFCKASAFNESFVGVPDAELVPYWQGSGKNYSFNDISTIKVKLPTGSGTQTKDVDISGVLAIMFDNDAMGVANLSRRVTTNYNAKAEFYTNFYKFDAGYYIDLNENIVVFYVANGETGFKIDTTQAPSGTYTSAIIRGVEIDIDSKTSIPSGIPVKLVISSPSALSAKPVVKMNTSPQTVSDYDSENKRYTCDISSVTANITVESGT